MKQRIMTLWLPIVQNHPIPTHCIVVGEDRATDTDKMYRICVSTVMLLGCVASRPVIGWRRPPIVTAIGTFDSCYFSDHITYDVRPNNYVTSVKPAQSETTWLLVVFFRQRCQLDFEQYRTTISVFREVWAVALTLIAISHSPPQGRSNRQAPNPG